MSDLGDTDCQPPDWVKIKWCPVCGRDDRFTPFTGRSHFARGERCTGIPVTVEYAFAGFRTGREGDA